MAFGRGSYVPYTLHDLHIALPCSPLAQWHAFFTHKLAGLLLAIAHSDESKSKLREPQIHHWSEKQLPNVLESDAGAQHP